MNKDIGALQARVDERLAQLHSLEAEKASLDSAVKGGVFKPNAQKLLKKIARDIRSTKLLYGNAAGRLKEAQELQKRELSIQQLTTGQISEKGGEILPENSASGSTILGGENVKSLGRRISLDSMQIDDLGDHPGSETVVPHNGSFPLSTGIVAPSSLSPLLPISNDQDPQQSMEVSGDEGSFRLLDRVEKQDSVVSDSSDMLSDLPPGSISIHDDSEMLLVTEDDKVELQERLNKLKRKPPIKAPPIKAKQKVKYVEIDSDGSGVASKKPAKESAAATKLNIGSGDKPFLAETSKGRGKSQKRAYVIASTDEDDVAGPPVKSTGRRKGRTKERVIASTNDDDVVREYQPSQHKVEKAERTAEAIAKKRFRAGDEQSQMQIIEAWLSAARNHTEKPLIPFPTRDLARKDSEYLTRITTSDPRLAVEFLENSWHNYLCVYHVSQDRKPVSEVNNIQGPIKIFGIPLPRNQNTSPQGTIARVPGHLHCGCDERVALAGFAMWKTWKVRALIEGKLIVEGLNKPFHPRQVLFLLQFLKSKFGYTVEDMFTNSTDEGEELRKEADVMAKVANFCARRRWELIGEKMQLNYNVDDDVELGEPQFI